MTRVVAQVRCLDSVKIAARSRVCTMEGDIFDTREDKLEEIVT